MSRAITRTIKDGIMYGGIFVAQQNNEKYPIGARYLQCSRATDKVTKVEMLLSGEEPSDIYHYTILLEEAPPRIQREFTNF